MGTQQKQLAYDVEFADGHHELASTRAEAYAALEHGATFAEQAEASNWYGAAAAEYRPEAEAEYAPRVIDLNAVIQSVLDGAS